MPKTNNGEESEAYARIGEQECNQRSHERVEFPRFEQNRKSEEPSRDGSHNQGRRENHLADDFGVRGRKWAHSSIISHGIRVSPFSTQRFMYS